MSLLLSIIIPTYKSEGTIEPLVDQLVAALTPRYSLEIVLVNDCSPDGTEAACVRAQKRHPDIVRFFSLSKNVGEHNAVMAGLNQCRGDIAVIMDDDFQNPISEIDKLVVTMQSGDHDVVYAVYDKKYHTFFQNAISRINDLVANIILRKPRNLYLSSFKAVNRFVIDQVIPYTLPYPYIDGLILRITNNIGRVSVAHAPRQEGASNYTFVKWARLWLNMFTNFSVVPLRVAVVTGVIFSLIGLFLGASVAIEHFTKPGLPRGYTSLMVAISIFSGAQLIAVGLIGEYLGRMFLSLNRHPQYTIRKKFDSSAG